MTRFLMSLDDAVNLVFYAFERAKPGDLFVQKSPASSIENLSKAMMEIFNLEEKMIEIIGTRYGEKLFEVLLSREEMSYAIDSKDYYRIPANYEIKKYKNYIDEGEKRLSNSDEYTSNNTYQLNSDEVKNLLLGLPIIQSLIKGKYNFD